MLAAGVVRVGAGGHVRVLLDQGGVFDVSDAQAELVSTTTQDMAEPRWRGRFSWDTWASDRADFPYRLVTVYSLTDLKTGKHYRNGVATETFPWGHSEDDLEQRRRLSREAEEGLLDWARGVMGATELEGFVSWPP